jgi:hypothetical protein
MTVLSRIHSTSQVLRWPTPRSQQWTERFLDRVANDSNVLAVVAIGSAVRPNVRSVDFDLVVICEKPDLFHQTRPIEIDLRVYAADEIEHQIGAGHDLLGWTVKFGKVLYERNNFWTSICNVWNGRLPMPSSNLARERAVSAYRRLMNVLDIGDVCAAHEQALSYLTHIARAELLDRKVYPASRPELPKQLRMIGEHGIAECLEYLLTHEPAATSEIAELIENYHLTETR